MKCPKCGAENPSMTVICQECGWDLDVPYRQKSQRNPLAFAVVSLVIGIAGVACWLAGVGYGAIALGAVGMVIGGYSVNLPRYLEGQNKILCMGMSGAGILLSIFAFMFGIMLVA